MEHVEGKTRLIRNRSGALIAVCLTGYLATLDFRAAASHSPYTPRWLFPLDPLSAPNWAVAAVNIAFYLCMLWFCISLYRGAQGKERVIVAGFSATVVIMPIKILVAPHAIVIIRSLQAAGMGVAF